MIAAHGCYAMTATAALTAQNTQGVYGIHETPSTFVQKQIDACFDDIGVDVLKTGRQSRSYNVYRSVKLNLQGMLASMQTVLVVANAMRQHNVSLSVVDPVRAFLSSPTFDALLTVVGHGFYQRSSATPRESREDALHRNITFDDNLYTQHPRGQPYALEMRQAAGGDPQPGRH